MGGANSYLGFNYLFILFVLIILAILFKFYLNDLK